MNKAQLRAKFLIFGMLLLIFSNGVHAYLWTSAIPTEVHIVPDGLVLVGDFDNTGVSCATGPKAIYLKKSDPNYKEKLSTAITAKVTGKKIRVLINDPLETNCVQIGAFGYVPVAFHYYWQFKD